MLSSFATLISSTIHYHQSPLPKFLPQSQQLIKNHPRMLLQLSLEPSRALRQKNFHLLLLSHDQSSYGCVFAKNLYSTLKQQCLHFLMCTLPKLASAATLHLHKTFIKPWPLTFNLPFHAHPYHIKRETNLLNEIKFT